MSTRLNLLLAIAGVVIAWSAVACGDDGDGPSSTSTPAATEAPTETPGTPMEMSSSAFADGEAIPATYTCEGEGISPPLQISNVPSNAAALALTIVDTDVLELAHWMVWNIEPDVTEVLEGSVPRGGFEGLTGAGSDRGYTPICPFTGEHVYRLTLYALAEPLTLDQTAGLAELEFALGEHLLAQATLAGRYQRSGTPAVPQ